MGFPSFLLRRSGEFSIIPSGEFDTIADNSGAAGIILHGQFAELLGIDLESRKPHEFQGIAHTPVRAYDHELSIRLKEDRHEYRVMCSIMPDLSTSALLGQRGFFDNYKVTFECYNQRVELTPRSPAKT